MLWPRLRSLHRPRQAASMVAALVLTLPPPAAAEGPPAGQAVASAAGPASLQELAELLKAQQKLLEDQERRLEEQGRLIEALEKKITATGELALSSQNRLDEQEHKPAAPTVEVAVAQRHEESEKAVAKPELEVKDISEEFPRAFKIPGTDAAMRIGGQTRLVVIRNFGPVGTDDRFVTSSIPVEGSEEADKGPRTTYSVDPSRLNFDVRTPSGVGYFRAFVEADFAGSGRTLRLRHAYGQWRNLTIGQTWSTFSDPRSRARRDRFRGPERHLPLPATAGPLEPRPGRAVLPGPGRREPQPVDHGGRGGQPGPRLRGACALGAAPEREGRPRLPSWRLPRPGRAPPAPDPGRLRGSPERSRGDERFRLQRERSAVGSLQRRRPRLRHVRPQWRPRHRPLHQRPGDAGGPGRHLRPHFGHTLQALPVGSAYVGYQHWWSNTVRTTATYGGVFVDNLDIQTPDSLRETQRTSLNLSWSPTGRIDLVSEFLWGRRVDKDGKKGTATQLQLGGVIRF